ncbi:hypothetical protein EC988_001888, partial [Linderina pennispora]
GMLDRFLASGNAIEGITKSTDPGFPLLVHNILGLQPELTDHPSLGQTLMSFISNQNSRLFCAISELQSWYGSDHKYPVLQLTAKNIDSIFKRSSKEARPYTAEMTYAQRLIKIFQRKNLAQWAGIVRAYCEFYKTDKKCRGVPAINGAEWEEAEVFLPHGFDMRTLKTAAVSSSDIGDPRHWYSDIGDNKENVKATAPGTFSSRKAMGLLRKRRRVVSVSEPCPTQPAAKRMHQSRRFTEPTQQPVPSPFLDSLGKASVLQDGSLWQMLSVAGSQPAMVAFSPFDFSVLSASQVCNSPTLLGAPEHLGEVDTMMFGSAMPLGLRSLMPIATQGPPSLVYTTNTTSTQGALTLSDITGASRPVGAESTLSDELLDQTFVGSLDDAAATNINAIVEKLIKSEPCSVSDSGPATWAKAEHAFLADCSDGVGSNVDTDRVLDLSGAQ